MTAAGALLRIAAGFHRAGALNDAERLYERVLDHAPDHAQTLWLAAVAARENGRPVRACELAARLAVLAPAREGLHALLAAAWEDRGHLDHAVRMYRQGLALVPGDAAMLTNLGLAMLRLGRPGDAVAWHRHAVAAAPCRLDTRLNLARTLLARCRSGALREARRALALAPGEPLPWILLGESWPAGTGDASAETAFRTAAALAPQSPAVHRALGRFLLSGAGPGGRAEERYRRAAALAPGDASALVDLAAAAGEAMAGDAQESLLRRAIRRQPRLAVAHANLSALERAADRTERAVAAAQFSVCLDPGEPQAWSNLASALDDSGRRDEAARAMRRALNIEPAAPRHQANLAMMLLTMERLGAARAAIRRALALSPADDGIRFNASFLAFKCRCLAAGYRFYESGLSGRRDGLRHYGLPRWRGGPLAGRRLIVEAEQGLGDEIRFASCYPDLVRLGGSCVVEADPRLVSIFRRSFPEVEFRPRDRDAPPPEDGDAWVPAGSLPGIFRPEYESFPREPGFLVPDPRRMEEWRERFASLPGGPVVGVSWRSRRMRSSQSAYFTTLDSWASLLSADGVSFVNLQYDRTREEIAAARERHGVTIVDWPEVDLMNDLESAFALSASLDLAITVPTTVNDEVGAVGTECWVLWPGLLGELGRRGHPYYPRHRLLGRRYGSAASVSLDHAERRLRRRYAAA